MSAAMALREDFSAADFHASARESRNTRQCRRLLALAAVAERRSRGEAAAIGGMERPTLRARVQRFNAEGPERLLDRKTDGVVCWRRIDLKAVIEARFGVVFHGRPVSRLLDELGLSHLSAQPRHPAQKPEMLEDLKKLPAHPSRRG